MVTILAQPIKQSITLHIFSPTRTKFRPLAYLSRPHDQIAHLLHTAQERTRSGLDRLDGPICFLHLRHQSFRHPYLWVFRTNDIRDWYIEIPAGVLHRRAVHARRLPVQFRLPAPSLLGREIAI